jgi:aspartate aminotransferase/aminotransferase
MHLMTPPHWIADRAKAIEASGIRRIFDLGRSLADPVNLSIGQPHFDVPDPVKAAAKDAIDRGLNGYTVTQGVAELRDRLRADVRARFPHEDREVLVTSGTSGGLLLAMLAAVNPGDEVIVPDPYFVSYPHLVTLAGGRAVFVDNYSDFRLDPDRVRAAVTDRTKVILTCSPSNPTGAVTPPDAMRAVAELARDRGILLISDEIYRAFQYDEPAHSPAEFNEDVLVVEGFGKTYGMTGWRLGYAHGPRTLIEEMAKLQQMTFVCAPTPFQSAGLAALDFDVSGIVADYRRKRDLLAEGLRGRFEFAVPGGAFYLYPKSPWGTGTEFVTEAIRQNLLIIPGVSFSRRDTHFRVSYAAPDETIRRGVEILNRLADRSRLTL